MKDTWGKSNALTLEGMARDGLKRDVGGETRAQPMVVVATR